MVEYVRIERTIDYMQLNHMFPYDNFMLLLCMEVYGAIWSIWHEIAWNCNDLMMVPCIVEKMVKLE